MSHSHGSTSIILLLAFGCLVASATPQAFSFGASLGSSSGAVPSFDSQKSSSVNSAIRGNPFASFGAETISRTRGPTGLSFEDFFSSSRVAIPNKSISPRGKPRFSQTPSKPTTRQNRPTPNPTITSRGAPAASSARQSTSSPIRSLVPKVTTTPVPVTREPFRRVTTTNDNKKSSSRNAEEFDGRRVKTAEGTVRSNPDLSSRGRVQEEPIIQPVTRPHTTTESSVPDVRENLIGHSICARGKNGDLCRTHLANTAMACTSGFCKECQQCGTMSADLWPKCCRDHYLCCRPLGRACQTCDKPALTPFCGVAFGRCN